MRIKTASLLLLIFAWAAPAKADPLEVSPEAIGTNVKEITSPYKERRISRLCHGACIRGLELGRPYTRIEIRYSDDDLEDWLIRTYRFHLPEYCSDQFLCQLSRSIPGYYYTYSCKSIEMIDETGLRTINCF